MAKRSGEWWYQSGPIQDGTMEFDLAFWQSQGPSAIFGAAWELVETAWKLKGGNSLGDPISLTMKHALA
jgi:hypothetical protein